MPFKKIKQPKTNCSTCGFELWVPIVGSTHADLGLYNDDRFPGRCILTLKEHWESLEAVPMDTMLGFMRDIQIAMQAIRCATGAARVNVSILGNREPHLHAHLIPRFPDNEQFPDCSPWNDLRPKGKLGRDEVEAVKAKILECILRVETRKSVIEARKKTSSPEPAALMNRDLVISNDLMSS